MRAFAEHAQNRQEWARTDYVKRKPYGMCWEGELLLTQLMAAPQRPFLDCSRSFLDETVRRRDLTRSGVCRTAHVMAAYWRWRKITL